MTTGRINQVTIVHRPRGGSESVKRRGVRQSNRRAPGRPPVIESNRATRGAPAIQLPFLNSPRSESAEEGDRDTVGLGHIVLGWRPSVAGHAHRRLPVHGRSPECVNFLTFANGQQPTGSLVARSL